MSLASELILNIDLLLDGDLNDLYAELYGNLDEVRTVDSGALDSSSFTHSPSGSEESVVQPVGAGFAEPLSPSTIFDGGILRQPRGLPAAYGEQCVADATAFLRCTRTAESRGHFLNRHVFPLCPAHATAESFTMVSYMPHVAGQMMRFCHQCHRVYRVAGAASASRCPRCYDRRLQRRNESKTQKKRRTKTAARAPSQACRRPGGRRIAPHAGAPTAAGQPVLWSAAAGYPAPLA